MITLAGISHRTAAVQVRGRLSIAAERIPDVLRRAAAELGPAALLATCNRLELYVDGSPADDRLVAFLARETGAEESLVRDHLRIVRDGEAVRHLFRVAAGLESMVLGESEVLGQVRDALSAAVDTGSANAALGRLFHTAIRTGRRARSSTAIGCHVLSVSSIAVAEARTLVPALEAASVLLIGAGAAGRAAAATLADCGVRDLVVVNRTRERAEALAADLGGRAAALAALPQELARTDVLVASTGAPGTVVTTEMVAAAMRLRPARPLFIVDIAVPRDVDPAVARIAGVSYRDLDDLEAVAAHNSRLRAAEIEKVEQIVAEEEEAFAGWVRERSVTPTISALTARAERIRREQLEKTLRRLGASEAERALLESLTRALVKQLLHEPIAALRRHRDSESYLSAARALFALDGVHSEAETCSPTRSAESSESAESADAVILALGQSVRAGRRQAAAAR